MGRLYDAYVEVGPRFTGFGDIKKQGDRAGKEYGQALAEAAAKAAKANVQRLGEALAKARSAEADAAGKVRVAEAKLAEVRADSKAKASVLAAAEEAVAAAHRKAAAASDTSKQAADALGKAQKRVADAAESAGRTGGGRFTNAFKGALSKIGGEKEGKQVATRFGVGMNGAIGSIVSRSAGIFAAGFAVVKSAEIFKGFIADAAESARVGRLTAQVIKSTGGAAKITADQVGDLATAISNKTGADDETIQSGANLLLTFTNIRNEVGKGNDIFNQAASTVTDMAAALNNGEVSQQGVKAASIQLGKALNDPIKGVTALQKVGVSFTEDQKKQIKTLVESGNTMQAQKVILGELSKEFGGAAAAAGDPFTRLTTIFGNLGEELGGYLLPYAEKFANFVSNKLIPGVSGLVALLVKGDFTSGLRQAFGISEDSGFVEFLFRVRDAATAAFGYFKTEVVPRLQEFGSFLIGTVIPAVAGFVTKLVSNLAPAVKDVFGFFRTQVLPRLQEFASFLGGKVLPPLAAFADKVLTSKDFLIPFAGIILGVVSAMKAWAIAQGILNVVMSANPIGLVVVAIAGLVAGLIYAFKHSTRFREVLQGAWAGIQKAAQVAAPLIKAAILLIQGAFSVWWNYFAKPILAGFGAALVTAWGLATKFGQIVVAGFNAIKAPAFAAIRFVIDKFLGFVETILRGAGKAFGWVPGLGPKLKAAATEFAKFRDGVNRALAGVQDQQINFTIKYTNTGVNLSTPSSVGRRATGGPGGPVSGPGTTTSDEAGLYRLSNKEWVIKAASSMKYGDRAMSSINNGTATVIPGLATGGRPGMSVQLHGPNVSKLAREVAAHVKILAKPIANQLAKSFIGGGSPGAVRSFRGERLNDLTISRLLHAERILGRMFHIMQGSYSTRVSASGSTHAGGGAMDTDGPGGWNAAVRALRASGFAAWHRTPAQGPWGHHIHSIAIGDPSASAAAKAQVRSYLRGGDGLGGMANGGKVGVYDRGGRWPSGTIGVNTSGKTETVVPGDGVIRLHPDDIRALAAELANRPVLLDGRRIDDAVSRRALSY